ncbi:MAG TPA: putative sulfate/molybdate transporter [Arenibaculum sp.]|nr:putative sulfate/molybdate transporter [Arenibaculum sp.]
MEDDDRNGPDDRTGKSTLGELGGSCGDLGTFLPHAIGAMTIAGLAPQGVLLGFGIFLVGSGLFYGLPMAVQPMKAVSAVLLTGDMDAGEVAATGLMIGAVMLVLGLTGAIGPIARLIPQSVTAGLQLGLGLAMGLLGLELLGDHLWFGLLVLAVLLVLMRVPRCPAAPLTVLFAIIAGYPAGVVEMPDRIPLGWQWPAIALPSWEDMVRAVELAVIPQLPLTLTNAVIVTAALSRDLFPRAAGRATERNLALSTGLANLALAPFGAMPMCHGAGGVQAQYRFGARTGLAPVLFGSLLLVLALGLSEGALALFGLIPAAAMGSLLLIAGTDLALSRRLFDARPACWPAIAMTAILTLLANPAVALVCGWALETGRGPAMRTLKRLRRHTHC